MTDERLMNVWLKLILIPTLPLGVFLAGCSMLLENPAASPPPTAAVVGDDARRDAEAMAEALGIPIDEAIRRLRDQDAIGRLGAELERKETGTFAGLWIRQLPEYRVVVAFTRDGDETIRPYVAHTPLAALVDVRPAEATLAELRAAQRAATQLVARLDLQASSGINVQENRVELYVTDRELFDRELQQAAAQLPDHVVAVTIYEPLGDNPPFAMTPDPAVYFPQLRTRSTSLMAALLQGRLSVRGGCLRIETDDGSPGYLVIWQPDYFLTNNAGTIEMLDRQGQVVARVGAEIRMGGGEALLTPELEQQLRAPIPRACGGPYWLMGDIIPRK